MCYNYREMKEKKNDINQLLLESKIAAKHILYGQQRPKSPFSIRMGGNPVITPDIQSLLERSRKGLFGTDSFGLIP